MNAILVIDNSVYGPSGGGVRLAPDITVDEIIRLARAMTLKLFSDLNYLFNWNFLYCVICVR